MNIQFLGTGAADWDWTSWQPGTRGSTSTLIDGHVLIDAGAAGWDNLIRNHVNSAEITDLLITHSHSDHLNLPVVGRIAAVSGNLTVWTSVQTAERLRTLRHPQLNIKEIHWGDTFCISGLKITVLPANHALEDVREEAFHFLFETPSKRFLYALDGAWMMANARRFLDGKTLDLIVWDATSGNHYHDWRFAEHNDLGMIDSMRMSLISSNFIKESTIHVFNHIARTLWPETREERQQLAEQHHGILAEDGMNINI